MAFNLIAKASNLRTMASNAGLGGCAVPLAFEDLQVLYRNNNKPLELVGGIQVALRCGGQGQGGRRCAAPNSTVASKPS